MAITPKQRPRLLITFTRSSKIDRFFPVKFIYFRIGRFYTKHFLSKPRISTERNFVLLIFRSHTVKAVIVSFTLIVPLFIRASLCLACLSSSYRFSASWFSTVERINLSSWRPFPFLFFSFVWSFLSSVCVPVLFFISSCKPSILISFDSFWLETNFKLNLNFFLVTSAPITLSV